MSVEPYGTAIHDAIARGDARSLQQLVSRARELTKQQGDLVKAIRDGEQALAKLQKTKGK